MSNTQSNDPIEHELITDPSQYMDLYEESNNDLIHLSFSKDGLQYNITPKFQNVLETSQRLAQESTQLLSGATADTIDEDELSRIRNEMKPIKAYRKDVDETLKDVRRVFNDTRDNFTGHITSLLESANFDVIEQNEEKAKVLNKDVLALRNKRNWEAVEEAYIDALNIYPELIEKYPRRLSFETFANENDKLASGAKNWKLNDAVINTIKQYIQNVYTNHDIITRINSKFEDELIARYDRTGDVKAALDLDDKFKAEEAAALARQQKIIEQEAMRKAKELERKRVMEEQAKKQAEEAQRKAEEAKKAENAKKPAPNVVSSSPFGIHTPAPVSSTPRPVSQSAQIAERVGFKKISQRMQKDDWSLSSLESMDLLHRFLKGVYDQEAKIVEFIKSPEDVMTFVKEFVDHTR